MPIKSLKAPFQYPKISLDKEKGLEQKRAKNMAGTLKRIWSYLAREKGKLSLVLVMVFATSALSLLGPYLVGMAIDNYIVTREFSGLGMLLIWLIGIYIFHSAAMFLQNYWMIGIAQNTVQDMRS